MKDHIQTLAEELVAMANYEMGMRQELEGSGEIFKGYHPQLENIHHQNAMRLEMIMEETGWPDVERFGPEANEAALIIVLNAISLPDFQKAALQFIKKSIDEKKEEPSHYAFLYDRICFNERRPQLFGTQFDWDSNNEMSAWQIEFPEKVNYLRAEFGLPTLEEQTAEIRETISESGETPGIDFETRQREILEWCKRTGWIK